MTSSRFNKLWFSLQDSRKCFKHKFLIPSQHLYQVMDLGFLSPSDLYWGSHDCPDRSQGVCKQHPCSMLEPGKKSSQKFSKKQGVGPSHKPFNTIRQHWMVYGNQWEGCDDFYIAERARPFGMRFMEHVAITRASTAAVGDHLKW